MEVNNVLSTYQVAANNSPAANTASNELDSGQFMQILLAQLTHQNPLEPMDNAEMMSQFSQLNSLQELRGINSSMQNVSTMSQTAYLASLVGKVVKANRADGKVIEGVVEGVVTEVDNPQIRIGDEVIDLLDVVEVKGE
ncbi:MAG: hypothetical protein KA473_04015 [Anaerolineales bacterium]|uniref:flagellar hook assembly protein FlgD n=1 Tax=Candidatus Villigracilis vicinus TaxID=3140679 RepID=UPI001B78D0C5|nr:hypothetical protein [Anaerolineales bacterium]MBP6179033.1 hypothetical protein [Anaerolineales bacterium]MBP6208579.1 hypothetical protein [Anaerolineales bacterium]